MIKKTVLCLAILLATNLAFAQIQKWEIEGNRYVLNGRNLPKYFCVRAFFDSALFCYRNGEDSYNKFLEQLGIKLDTDAAPSVARAMFLSQALSLEKLDVRPYVDNPSLFKEMQDNWLRNQILSLKKIYRTMLDELKQRGASIDAVEKFIDEDSRNSTEVVTSPEDPTELLTMTDLFEE